MVEDIFDFWAECPPEARMHPRDAPVFGRAGEMGFDLDCLPTHWGGPLRTAPVVMLYLSAGRDPSDAEEAKTPEGQARYAEIRQGFRPLANAEENVSHNRWWKSRTAVFGKSEEVQGKVAILNIGAYHSVTFEDPYALMALPSSRASLDWVQSYLLPQAERGERVVICMRSARAWGIKRGEKYLGLLFAPKTNAAGHMAHGPQREMVIAAAKRALGLTP